MGIGGDMGIEVVDSVGAYKSDGAKSFESGNNNNKN